MCDAAHPDCQRTANCELQTEKKNRSSPFDGAALRINFLQGHSPNNHPEIHFKVFKNFL